LHISVNIGDLILVISSDVDVHVITIIRLGNWITWLCQGPKWKILNIDFDVIVCFYEHVLQLS